MPNRGNNDMDSLIQGHPLITKAIAAADFNAAQKMIEYQMKCSGFENVAHTLRHIYGINHEPKQFQSNAEPQTEGNIHYLQAAKAKFAILKKGENQHTQSETASPD